MMDSLGLIDGTVLDATGKYHFVPEVDLRIRAVEFAVRANAQGEEIVQVAEQVLGFILANPLNASEPETE